MRKAIPRHRAFKTLSKIRFDSNNLNNLETYHEPTLICSKFIGYFMETFFFLENSIGSFHGKVIVEILRRLSKVEFFMDYLSPHFFLYHVS